MSVHEHRRRSPAALACGVLTVSDTRTPGTDESGDLAKRMLEEGGHRVAEYRIVPDEPERIRETIEEWLDRPAVEAIVVNGGTGISPRDRTIEVVAGLLDRSLDGFGELFRWLSYQQIGPAAMLSRAVAGLARGKPVFSLPGSPAAVRLALEKLILPEIGHVVSEARKR